MIDYIRNNFGKVCLACFALTTGAGVSALLVPKPIFFLAGFEITPQTLFLHRFGFLLVALVGLWYLIIMTDPAKYRPLLALAVLEKFAFVAFFALAIWKGQLRWTFIPIALGDLAMGAACCVYLVLGGAQKYSTVGDTGGREKLGGLK